MPFNICKKLSNYRRTRSQEETPARSSPPAYRDETSSLQAPNTPLPPYTVDRTLPDYLDIIQADGPANEAQLELTRFLERLEDLRSGRRWIEGIWSVRAAETGAAVEVVGRT